MADAPLQGLVIGQAGAAVRTGRQVLIYCLPLSIGQRTMDIADELFVAQMAVHGNSFSSRFVSPAGASADRNRW